MHDLPPWLFGIFTAVSAFGVLLQALVLLSIFLALRRTLKRADELTRVAEEHIVPTMAMARKLLEEETPKIKVAIQNTVELTQSLRTVSEAAEEKSAEVSAAVDDLLKMTEMQAARVDEMLTGTLDSIAQATATLQRYVGGPARRISGLMNGLRAGFDVLRNRDHEAHAAADGDHFV